MKTTITSIARSATRSLLPGLLVCLPCVTSHAPIIFGASDTTFSSQATAVSGFALSSGLTFVNTAKLLVPGGVQEAAPLSDRGGAYPGRRQPATSPPVRIGPA